MTVSVDELLRHVRSAWGADACYPDMSEEWTPDNPSRDQCGMTALVVQDVLGGTVVVRPPNAPHRHREQYELLRGRVLERLAAPPATDA
jgi:hypothetical protein